MNDNPIVAFEQELNEEVNRLVKKHGLSTPARSFRIGADWEAIEMSFSVQVPEALRKPTVTAPCVREVLHLKIAYQTGEELAQITDGIIALLKEAPAPAGFHRRMDLRYQHRIDAGPMVEVWVRDTEFYTSAQPAAPESPPDSWRERPPLL